MSMRSLGVIGFIGLVGGTGIYFAERPTIAHGDVLAADLVATNPVLRGLTCDERVPIGMTGGRFKCRAEFKNGDTADLTFAIDRAGAITLVDQSEKQQVPRVKKTSDPWGD